MRTLSSTLLAAQRSPATTPHLEVLLRDRDVGVLRLRWQRWYTGTEVDGPCAAALPADGSLLRARVDPSTNYLYVSRIATPASGSTYSTWNGLSTTTAAAPRLGLSTHTTRALLVAVKTDNVTIEHYDSSDSGASWPGPTTALVAGGAITAIGCALFDSTGSAAIFYAVAGVVYASTRTGRGAWSASAAWTNSLTTVTGISALASSGYDLIVSGTDAAGDAGVWSLRYGVGGGPPTWTALVPIVLASAGTLVSYTVTGLGVADVPRVALVESYSGGGSYSRVQLASALDGTTFTNSVWRDPMAFEHASAYGPGIAGVGVTDAWLVAPHGVWHAALASAAADLTGDVLEADFEQTPAGGRLRLLLRNDHARFPEGAAAPALEPGNELLVSPGYVTTAGAERSPGPRFWISSVTRRRAPGVSLVELEAVDAWGVLAAWRAPRQLVWPAGTLAVDQIVEELTRHAGLARLGSFSLEALLLQPGFTMRAGEDGAAALRRLLATVPDEARPDVTAIEVFTPLIGDTSTYEYGTTHAVSALAVTTARPRVGWARVFGAGVVAQDVDGSALARGASAAIHVDDNLATQARADARAATLLRQSALATERGQLTAAVNAGQELGDVIEVTDPTLGLEAARFRVAALRLRFVRGGSRPRYDLTLTLSDV